MASQAFAPRTGVTDAQVRTGAGLTFQITVGVNSWLADALPPGVLVATPAGRVLDYRLLAFVAWWVARMPVDGSADGVVFSLHVWRCTFLTTLFDAVQGSLEVRPFDTTAAALSHVVYTILESKDPAVLAAREATAASFMALQAWPALPAR